MNLPALLVAVVAYLVLAVLAAIGMSVLDGLALPELDELLALLTGVAAALLALVTIGWAAVRGWVAAKMRRRS